MSAAPSAFAATVEQIDAGLLLGHNVPQEAPVEFAEAILQVDGG